MKKKALLISLIALAMALCMFAGATIAYLFVVSQDVVNTFAPSNIELTLVESDSADTDTDKNKNEYQMIPGATITKDPKVSASADIAYYVFVKVVKGNEFDKYMTYAIADGWIPLPNVDGVYYRAVDANGKLNDVPVIKDNKVSVSTDVTKEQMTELKNSGKYPTLTFTAYAIQQEGFGNNVAKAWNEVSKTN